MSTIVSMTSWQTWHFRDALVHIVENEHLSNLLHDDMARRGHLLSKSEEQLIGVVQGDHETEAMFDLGGMYTVGEPREEFRWSGLDAYVPCRQVPSVIRQLDRLPLRRFAASDVTDGARLYYKFKIWHRAWVMSPASYAQLVQHLVAIESSATKRAGGFFAQATRRRERAIE